MNKKIDKLLSEMFGEPIGVHAGQPTVGVRDERLSDSCPDCGLSNKCNCGMSKSSELICPECGQMPVDGTCGCLGSETCPSCGKMPLSIGTSCDCIIDEEKEMCEACGEDKKVCECGYMNEAKKKKGPSKKTAKKILKGTKTFKEKIKKVEKWAENPEAAAAWMMHRATGRWPSEK